MNFISLFALSLFSSFILILLFKKIFYHFSLLDNPVKYWYKRKPVPYSMGVVFFINFLLLSYFFIEPNYKILLLFIFWWIITLLSFFDDFFDINPKIRLFFQIFIWVMIALTSIKIGYISNIFWWIIDLHQYYITLFDLKIYYIPILFTVFWYVLIFNALNWSDGIPGLTSWLSGVSFFVLFLLWLKLYYTDTYVGWVKNAEFIIQTTLILLWSICVFWFFDKKENILMGDSGTMFLWFMLASLAIISGGKIATVVAVFWIYLIDAFYVIIKRIIHKKNPLKKDFSHLHHRLLHAGLEKKQILLVIYSLSLFFWISSLFLDRLGKIFVFVILIFIVIFLNFFVDKIKIKK